MAASTFTNSGGNALDHQKKFTKAGGTKMEYT